MPRLYHSSAMLLVDKSSGIVFFTDLCIIRGKLCSQTFRHVQPGEMGLEQLHHTSFQPFRTWRHPTSAVKGPRGPSRSDFLHKHRR